MHIQVSIRVKVHHLLSELSEETELRDRAFALDTGEANAVHAATDFGQGRHLAVDSADITRGAIQVTVDHGCASGIQTLVVDVAIVEQRDVVVYFDCLAHVLGHGCGVCQRREIHLFGSFDQRFALPEEGVHLVGTSTFNGGGGSRGIAVNLHWSGSPSDRN